MSCLLCGLNLDYYKTSNVCSEGIQTLIQCSIDRKDNLADSLRNLESITVHYYCRRRYTRRDKNGKPYKFHGPEPPKPDNDEFEFIPIINKNQLSSNGKKREINRAAELKKRPKRRKLNQAHYVLKDTTKETILKFLKKRQSAVSMKIIKRIQDVDLVQVKAQYHKMCFIEWSKREKGLGRAECPFIKAAVEKISRYIDTSDRTEFTKTELKSAGTSDDYEPDWRTISKKLKEKYEGKIYFTSVSRSSIVTIVRGSQTGGSAFIQPWNLNSTELGEQKEYLLKNKRKYYMKHKKLAEEDEQKHVKNNENDLVRDDIKIQENDKENQKETKYKETMTEYNDNDFIDDTLNSEEYASENKSNILICQICLSLERRLEDLGNYRDILQKIGSDIFIHDFEPKLFLVCWECIALLKNVKRFQNKIVIAQKLWNTEVQEPPKCLSTLSITTPSNASVSYTDEKQKGKNSQQYLEPEIVTVDILPQEDMPLIEKQEPAVEEINMDYYTFENDSNDFENDTKDIDNDIDDTLDYYETKDMDDENGDGSEYQEKIRPKLKRRKAQVKRKKCFESDDESYVPSKSTYQPKIRKSSSEDPDWEATVREKSQKVKKVTPKQKIPYTMIVQTYITETKIKREPIEPHELQCWLDTERNSDYFKTLKSKCRKCISEVAENHDVLCHLEKHPYVCDICESTFARNDEKESHVANHYYIFSCEFCRYKCYNETHMRCHVESHRRLVQCLECFAAFETFDVLKEHFNNLHRYAECDYCGKQFPHKRTVIKHIERYHTPQICPICNKSYSSYSRKMHHMNLKHRIERTEAAYCVQCDIQFDNVALLKRHVNTSYKHKHEWKREPPKSVKPYVKGQHKCPECPIVYSTKHHMKCHYNLVHAKKIKFSCNYCNKPFATKTKCKRHMRVIHEGYKYPKNKFCHICGRGFTANRILVNHIRTHTGERPFACPHCASSFAQKVALQSHIAHVHQQQPRTSGKTCTKRR